MASSSDRPLRRTARPHSALLGEEAQLVALIAQLDIAELERLRAPTGQLTDADVAMRLAAEEAMFQKDRELAAQLSTHGDWGWGDEWTPPAAPPTAERSGTSGIGTGWRALLPGPASSTPTRKPAVTPAAERLTGHNCAICMDPIRGVEIRAPCGDFYDKACVLELFEAATRDESLFPPRCCRQPIPLESVRAHMDAALAKRFAEKQIEFGTLQRVYCARSACSRFLGARVASPIARLLRKAYACTCGTRTCTWCRDEVHIFGVHQCTSEDEQEDGGVLALGAEAGWARCPGCAQLIELSFGCYHMTCRCKTEFCYLCRARWKTCGCTQWDEDRLFAAAEARVDAELADAVAPRRRGRGRNPPPPPPPRPPPAAAADVRPARPLLHLPQDAPRITMQDVRRLFAPALPPVPPRPPGPGPPSPPTPPYVPGFATRPAPPPAQARLPVPEPPRRPSLLPRTPAPVTRAAAGEQLANVARARTARTRQSAQALDWGDTPTADGDWGAERADGEAALDGWGAEYAGSGTDLDEWSAEPADSTVPAASADWGVEPAAGETDLYGWGVEPDWGDWGVVPADGETDLGDWDTMPAAHLDERSAEPTASGTALYWGTIPAFGRSVANPTKAPALIPGPSVALTPSPPSASAAAKGKVKDKGKGRSKDKGKQRETDVDATRNAMVQDMMERLREDHECAHTAWKWRGGGGNCEMCNHTLPHYLFRCTGCAVLACNRCRKNRI